jgi:glycosyltransferase involved in cell wall biosynthesis
MPPTEEAKPADRSGRPEVSVVVPTHDRRRLLLQTLGSILHQRGVDFEVLVVDDGSRDGTAELVAELGDGRVRVLRNDTPQGVAAARNRGIAEAAGEWLGLCDDDDLWAPDKLARQLQAARQSGREWVYGGAVRIDADQRILSGTPPPGPEELATRIAYFNVMPGGCSNAMVSRAVLGVVGPFDDGYKHFADWDLWIRLARRGLPAWVPSPLTGYRIHGGNKSLDVAGMMADLKRIQDRHGTRVDMAAFCHYLAWLFLRGGRRRQALRYFLWAAVQGQVRPVARSLSSILRSRLARRLPPRRRLAPGQPLPEWKEAAEVWLAELRPVDLSTADRSGAG